MNSPDLKAPSSGLIKYLLFFGSIALISFGAVYGLYFYKNKSDNKNEISKIVLQNKGMPEDFLNIEEETIQLPPPKRVIKAPKKIIKKKKKRKPAPKPIQVKKKKPQPKTSDLFTFKDNEISLKEKEKIRIRNKINNNRKGTSEAYAYGKKISQFLKVSTPPPNKTLKKWNEPEIKSSYPISMERVITIDKSIPAILINAINSELRGKVTAIVEKNIYGSHGRKILIPSGSKAIGYYKSIEKIGQERLSILWPRIITPEGINIHTEDASMTDSMGRSGITGEIDKRYGDKYGMAFLVSILTAATTYSLPVNQQNQQIIVESFGREVGGLSQTILNDNIDIKPRITIDPGSRIMITASKDIWFDYPKNNSVIAKEYREE